MCLEDLISYFAQPEDGMDHEEKQIKLKALRNRQDLFQEVIEIIFFSTIEYLI